MSSETRAQARERAPGLCLLEVLRLLAEEPGSQDDSGMTWACFKSQIYGFFLFCICDIDKSRKLVNLSFPICTLELVINILILTKTK